MNEEQVELVINSICSNDLNFIKEFVNANKDQIDSVTTFGTMLQIASREGKIENCDALEYARQYGQMEIYDYIKERLHKN